ncbi:hypothetical protein FB567DRAFT_99039 [Paraphoma chrysanthemicola]|uniref:Uncharacterized protein n=1 Tax=Paraphoma chrysanthemicola TaxID=798071 RepID=A0A8K0R1P6_9PLEO|nr:hypothetical protein FB567DRAFT_99039 [Paraphoma chrysanthemicola]
MHCTEQRGKAVGSDGKTETAGKCLARRACSAYLKRSLGTLVQALVCAMRAAAALRERGPVCFEPKRADEGLACWRVHCESWTPSGQATSNASNDVGLSVCGSHRGCTPSSCAGQNYAAAWLKLASPPQRTPPRLSNAAANGSSTRRTGRIIPSRPSHRSAALRPANLACPKRGMVRVDAPYWHRLVRPAHLCWPLPCARGATPNASMEMLLRYAARWRVPQLWSRRQSSAAHKGEAESVHG